MMALLLRESIAKEQATRLLCLGFTNFPTTFPIDLTSKTKVIGTPPLSSDAAKPAPAPYSGTFVPFRFTDTVRWLFLG